MVGPDESFLGVSRSLTGRRWRARGGDLSALSALSARHGLPDAVARALLGRGVGLEAADVFLQPTLRATFPNPSSFLGMDDAASALIDALVEDRRVWVFADYDVDGATSAAQLIRWFRAMGKDLPVYVPDRVREGYGPSEAAFRTLKSQGCELVVTVDCGAAAHTALSAAHDMGLEVVVIDHHLMRDEAPPARALVNPNHPECGSGQGNLAAAGVTFVLLAALNREARARGLFAGREEPDIRRWLDLAALGGVCDVTRLEGFNRALVRLGLQRMASWENPGLRALMAAAGASLDKPADTRCVGFVLGPRINAAGRIGRSDLGVRLLTTDDEAEARDLAEQLHQLNAERREVEAGVMEEAVRQIEAASNFDPQGPVMIAAAEDWHPGVVGVVAGRLRERFRRPAIVIGIDPVSGVGKGSGRSQPGVNLGRAVQAAFDEGLLLAGGGHAMAAGLTVRREVLPDLRAFLDERLAEESRAAAEADALEIDALCAPAAVDRGLWQAFQALAPFGPGNEEPLLALSGVRATDSRLLNGGHVACRLASEDGRAVRAIAWRSGDTPLGQALLEGAVMHVAGRLQPDDWNGRQGVQIEIEDACDPRRMTG
ncbi:single-stranded-DNA-specific exonuclease RecJ [Brevundimonas sp. 2R-24]|uniref:Single-stranded-DNA-specific exonuclease RecJ n=1 Tax=Peiella sedimenti TaxID=3061083 RepID=A0ABT8SJB4_9CAUL|nr:single-stranded-DNA-specific exonuclease RecJ [Caulobacteraceae bacterium XZ-24]